MAACKGKKILRREMKSFTDSLMRCSFKLRRRFYLCFFKHPAKSALLFPTPRRKQWSPWKRRGTNFRSSVDVSFSETWLERATTANTIWPVCRQNSSKRGKWSKFVWSSFVTYNVIREIKCFSVRKNKKQNCIVWLFDYREMLEESVSDLRSTMCELQERLHSVDGEGE